MDDYRADETLRREADETAESSGPNRRTSSARKASRVSAAERPLRGDPSSRAGDIVDSGRRPITRRHAACPLEPAPGAALGRPSKQLVESRRALPGALSKNLPRPRDAVRSGSRCGTRDIEVAIEAATSQDGDTAGSRRAGSSPPRRAMWRGARASSEREVRDMAQGARFAQGGSSPPSRRVDLCSE